VVLRCFHFAAFDWPPIVDGGRLHPTRRLGIGLARQIC
jgi:hypothetical protein